MTPARGAEPRRSPFGALLTATILAAALWLGVQLDQRRHGGAADAEGDYSAVAPSAGSGAGVAALDVRTDDGRVLALSEAGHPTVVMVSSETCTYCAHALRDLGRLSAGRPLPRLRIVTLEGAARGAPMVAAAGVRGALLAGPVSPAAAGGFTFQIRGTPTWLALDGSGRVTRTMLGYPGAQALPPWMAVMLGERERP